MRRLAIVLMTLCALWQPGAAGAADSEDAARQAMEMLARVSPPVRQDARAIVVFFDFFCPHCAEHVPVLLQWADTLPTGVRVRFAPLVANEPSRVRLAHAFLVGTKILGHSRSIPLARDLFSVAGGQRGVTDGEIYSILRRYCDEGALRSTYLDEGIRQSLKDIMADYGTYRIAAVPSVGFAGRYVVTPDDLPPNASGVQDFVQLLNGFASRMVAGDL